MPRKAKSPSTHSVTNRTARPRQPSPNQHLIEWGFQQEARGVPYQLIMLAQDCAPSSRYITLLVDALTSGQLANFPFDDSAEKWEHCYRRADHLFTVLGDNMGGSPVIPGLPETMGFGRLARLVSLFGRRVQRMEPAQLLSVFREFQASGEFANIWTDGRLVMLKQWNEHVEALRENQDDHCEWNIPPASTEFQFFLRVWWPCWSLYGRGAQELFTLAESGNLEALEHLIRLDKRILRIPCINRWLTKWQETGQHDVMKMLCLSMSETDVLRTTSANEKLRTLRLLYDLSEMSSNVPLLKIAKFRLVDLRDLLDAVAKDQGKLYDEDFCQSDESFRKAFQRMKRQQSVTAWDMFPKKRVP